jgi:cytochrome c553
MRRLSVLIGAILLGASSLVPASGQSNSAESAARAILQAKCVVCHGESRMSGLDLRTQETILKGGKRGPAMVPGKAAESLLYKTVQQEGELRMPQTGSPLTPTEVGILRDWINAGAHWEANSTTNSTANSRTGAATWWSFRKPMRPRVPAVGDSAWVRNPIDAFILARMEQHGLRPAPRADRRTLARRAYFDLHGLPPTPEQVDQFVNDKSSDAYERLIDHLLASPRYGERWGRYWLDLVRYADTSGFETDHFFITAWRYRDYVIQSFNSDKPYTTFVQEQIAADELWSTNMDLEGTLKLPKEKQENVNRRIGTSLFTLGSFPIEFTYYGDQFRAEWQADAVDTVGAAFLGLTVACARCHDHKFDPISQRDYYRMCALFAGSVEREIPLVSLFDIQTNSRNFPLLAQAQALKRVAGGGAGLKREGAQAKTDEAEEDAAPQPARAGLKREGAQAKTDEAEEDAAPQPARAGAHDPRRTAVLQQLGQAYLRAPERYPTANVLAHEEIVPDTHILVRGDFKKRGEKVEPGFLSPR